MPSSRYFAVAGPNERARRSLRRGDHAGRVGRRDLGRGRHRDGLEALGAEHRAEPAAAGVAAVVADRRVAHAALAGRADRGDPQARPSALAQPGLGVGGRQAPEVGGRLEPRPVAVDEQHRRRVARAATTIASKPVRLPAMAKWLDASASLSSPVSGDLATTANLADVVSGVPTSGEKQKASGASGPSGSTPGGASSCISQAPRPAPPR